MAGSVSEQISELSADLLLRAVGDLAQIIHNAGMALTSIGSEALAELIRAAQNNDKLSAQDKKALDKLHKAVEADNETPRQVTVLESDRENVEHWLKKQGVLFSTVRNDKQDCMPGFEKCAIVFLEKDALAVQNALVLMQQEKAYINELTPSAFLLAHKKKDISIMDGLSLYELEAFRELAKEHGLTYAAMETPTDDKKPGSEPTYKIFTSKADALQAAAALQMVAWAMTSEHKRDILEKIKERLSIKHEIQKLVLTGVPKGTVTVQTMGKTSVVENAKYIVNRHSPNQYLKMTAEGFVHFKGGKEIARVAKADPAYEDELQLALGEFSDAVVFDAEEWEQEGLDKANRRKQAVKAKVSVFPKKFDKNKEADDLQKAHKHKKEHEKVPESAWLFDRYDTHLPFAEVYEVNYNNHSEPPEKTVSVHYEDALNLSANYKYIDVSIDEKSLDNIISMAKERSYGNEYTVAEKETVLS